MHGYFYAKNYEIIYGSINFSRLFDNHIIWVSTNKINKLNDIVNATSIKHKVF